MLGITTNATYNGGEIEEHMKEAQRVVDLVGWKDKVTVIKGANGNFSEIREHLDDEAYDGSEAVDFIITEARKKRKEKRMKTISGLKKKTALSIS